MFWDLNGATFSPRFLRILHRAATMVLFPEWEQVPRTTMNLVMSFAGGMDKFICLLEEGILWRGENGCVLNLKISTLCRLRRLESRGSDPDRGLLPTGEGSHSGGGSAGALAWKGRNEHLWSNQML